MSVFIEQCRRTAKLPEKPLHLTGPNINASRQQRFKATFSNPVDQMKQTRLQNGKCLMDSPHLKSKLALFFTEGRVTRIETRHAVEKRSPLHPPKLVHPCALPSRSLFKYLDLTGIGLFQREKEEAASVGHSQHRIKQLCQAKSRMYPR